RETSVSCRRMRLLASRPIVTGWLARSNCLPSSAPLITSNRGTMSPFVTPSRLPARGPTLVEPHTAIETQVAAQLLCLLAVAAIAMVGQERPNALFEELDLFGRRSLRLARAKHARALA